jgi:hypothetical protein
MKLKRIAPANLSAKQKEAYHFQKVSAVLADYGYQTIKLSDDWCGADFVAQHLDGTVLKVQLKGRLTVSKKYEKKDLWICFPSGDVWYIYPHDIILAALIKDKKNSIQNTYNAGGGYSFPSLSKELSRLLSEYEIKENGA